MEKQITINRVFKGLNKRLIYFQSEEYLNSDYFEGDFPVEGLIDNLIDNLLDFEDHVIYSVAIKYEKRVIEIIENLQPKQREGFLHHSGETIGVKEIIESRKQQLLQEWKYELYYYNHYLNVIKNNSAPISESTPKKRELKVTSSNSKIKWLRNVNVLGTFFYDLWKGQEKMDKNGQKTTLPPLIKPEDKNTLINFLIANFELSDGSTLSKSSLSDYLNTSKSKIKSRARNKSRIELNY